MALDPANPTCDHATQTCDYLVSPSWVDADTCEPTIRMAATLTGDQLVAGGPGATFPFSIPLGGVELEIALFDARLEGTVTLDAENVVTLDGILGGAVVKQKLLDAVDAIPDDVSFRPSTRGALPELRCRRSGHAPQPRRRATDHLQLRRRHHGPRASAADRETGDQPDPVHLGQYADRPDQH